MRSSSIMDTTETNPKSCIRIMEEGYQILSVGSSLIATGQSKLVRLIKNFQIFIFSSHLSPTEARTLINILKMYQFLPLTLLKNSLVIGLVVNLTLRSLICLVLIKLSCLMLLLNVSGTSTIFLIKILLEMLMLFCHRKKLKYLWTGLENKKNKTCNTKPF